jgi:hypothetical protein
MRIRKDGENTVSMAYLVPYADITQIRFDG